MLRFGKGIIYSAAIKLIISPPNNFSTDGLNNYKKSNIE